MSFELTELPWLPEPPSDYRTLCRSVDPDGEGIGLELHRLASHRLQTTQSGMFSKAMARCLESGRDLVPLSRCRLAVLSSFTFDLVADCLAAGAARHGVAVEAVLAPSEQVMQTALDPRSPVLASAPDAILVAIDHRWLGLDSFNPDRGQEEDLVAPLRQLLNALRDHGSGQIVVTTLAVPPGSLFGSYERRFPGSLRARIQRFNDEVVALADASGALLFDVAALAEEVGTARWFDPVMWNLYKLPFGNACIPLYADALGRLLGAMRGKSRKCLVLDLDNTCWGGVIGDDGLEGIRLGPGSAEGECFTAIQRLARHYKDRGILLSVSSKNFDEVARGAFRDHPEMVLKEGDIAVFQANWDDKPSNLEAIARTLNIGLDALVLLDDNGAERAQVRAALPMVAVPELPADPAWYPAYLQAAGYFESISFSEEDRGRHASYAANAQRAEILHKSRDLGDYLTSLGMEIAIKGFDAVSRQRIAQLINKSNQFNLTTRRYTEAQVEAFEADPGVFTLQVRLKDKFGDFGMIAVVICQPSPEPEAWEIDTWLMSCRVLGRQVEQAMLNAIVQGAREAGVTTLVGRYFPTAKNAMVADHFDKLGFQRTGESEEGAREYRLDVASYEMADLPFRDADSRP